MPGYITIGKRFTDWTQFNYNEREYMVLNPLEMFLDLIKYKSEPRTPDLKSIIICGSQGSGKSTLIRYFVRLIENNPDFEGLTSTIETNDLRIIGDKRYAKYFEGKKVVTIICDDAIKEGMDSRRSMSGFNVDLTRQFCITRHVFEENYEPNCIIFMIFATQILSRLDATIRDTAQLKIFCNYSDRKWFQDEFPNPEDVEWLRISSYKGMFASEFDYRRFALAKTFTGDVVTIEVPFLEREEVPFPIVDRSIRRTEIIDMLVRLLLENFGDLINENKSRLKGFLERRSEKIENEFYYAFRKTDYVSAINRAISIQEEEYERTGDKTEKREEKKQHTHALREELMVFLKDSKNMTFKQIAKKMGYTIDKVKYWYYKIKKQKEKQLLSVLKNQNLIKNENPILI